MDTPPVAPPPYQGLFLRGWPLILVGVGLWLVMLFSAGALLMALGLGTPTGQAWPLRLQLVLPQVLGFGVSAVALGVLGGGVYNVLGLRSPKAQAALWAVLIGVCSMFVAIGLQMPREWFDFWPSAQASERSVNDTLRTVLSHDLWANLLVVGLLPAVCEELFFRGFLQRTLQQVLNPHVAIWLTALVFSLIHFQAFGFVSRWVLGAVLGYLAWWSGSVWPAVVAHATVNTVQAVVAYFAFNAVLPAELADDNALLPVWVTLVAVAALFGAMITFRKRFQQSTINSQQNEV